MLKTSSGRARRGLGAREGVVFFRALRASALALGDPEPGVAFVAFVARVAFVAFIGGVALALNLDVVVPFIERLLGVQFLNKDIYFISTLPSDLRASDLTSVVIISFILSLLATIYPSWRAARVQPAEALRYE